MKATAEGHGEAEATANGYVGLIRRSTRNSFSKTVAATSTKIGEFSARSNFDIF